jgi:hypothetical protein
VKRIGSSRPATASVPELTCSASIKLNAGVSLQGSADPINSVATTTNYSKPPLWPLIVVLSCTGIVAAGALALIGWIALALLGY